jgi:hypothetical protein
MTPTQRTAIENRIKAAALSHAVELNVSNLREAAEAFEAGAHYERENIINALRDAQEKSPTEWATWLIDQLSR